MNRGFMVLALAAASAACASSFPPPTQRLVETESAMREARETGAPADAKAAGNMKLAQEELAQAKRAMSDGDNERATYLLERARADADLAAMLARESKAEADAHASEQQARHLDAQLHGPPSP